MLKKRASIFRKENLPPTIGLLDETGIFSNNNDVYLKQRFSDKVFIKEVRNSSEHTFNDYNYCDCNDKNYSGFNVTLGGSLDILSPVAGCSTPECRCNAAINIARTAGLFANKLFITDYLSSYLYTCNNSRLDLSYVKMMTSVLSVLAPLIDNDIIELRTPRSNYCQDCTKKIDDQTMLFLDSVFDCEAEFDVTYFGSSKKRHHIMIHSPEIQRLCGTSAFTAQMSEKDYSSSPLKPNKKIFSAKLKDEPFFLSMIKDHFKYDLRLVIIGTNSARKTSSLFLAKSQLDTLFLSSLDRVSVKKNEIEQWEALRSIDLPWIGQLDIHQIIKLREEASVSLESLRDHITLGFMQGGQQRVTDVIAELTAEISELKRQILTNEIAKQSHNKYTLEYGSLAIALVFYGLASTVPVAAVGSVAALLASISHLHTSAKETEEVEAKIITSPAYALLKSRELLYCQERA